MKTLLVCVAVSLIAGPVRAADHNNPKTQYLALGDSLAFGFNPLIQPLNLSEFIGYPRIVSPLVNEGLANASCPGETTSTFIGASTVYFPGFDCVQWREQNMLYVPYNGAQNQLQYAVTFLQANPSTKLVTIDVGLNDLGLLQVNCQTQYAGNPLGILTCETLGLPVTLTTVGQNLGTILAALRATGYKQPIAVVDAFSFNYADLVETTAITGLNQAMQQAASQYGATLADIFPVFQRATAGYGGDPCAAGLLIKYPNGTCDTHPNVVGQALVAATVLESLASGGGGFRGTTKGR